MGNSVNHPDHYNQGTVEIIDLIELLEMNFHLGSAFKYIARAPFKEKEIEDLEKARWYIYRARDKNANYQRNILPDEVAQFVKDAIHNMPIDLDLRAALYLISVAIYNVSHDSFCLCLQAAAHSLDTYLERIKNANLNTD